MANFKKTGDFYVDPSNPNASNANAGSDPDFPKLSIQGGIDVLSAGQKLILADGLYNVAELLNIPEDAIIEGDGIVILEGDNSQKLFLGSSSSGVRFSIVNIIAINYLAVVDGLTQPTMIWEESIIINSPIYIRKGSGRAAMILKKCRLINSNYDVIFETLLTTGTITPSTVGIYDSIFIGSTVKTNVKLRNSYFQESVILDNTDYNIGDTSTIGESNFNSYLSTIFYIDTLYTSILTYKSENPTVDQNSISSEGLFNRVIGEISTFDFSVQGSSPLLGVGENGTNIGFVKRGIASTRFSDSVQNGTITNLVFDGQTWRVQDGFTTGTIESAVIDFGLTVKSPKPNIKGTINYLDNVPDFDNLLRDPNKCDFEVRYAIIGEDISVKTYKTFLYGEQLLLDNTAKSTGEVGFDWNNTVTIPMKQIQYRITLRQDFNS